MSKDELAQLRDENKKLRAQVEILTNALEAANKSAEETLKGLSGTWSRKEDREEEK